MSDDRAPAASDAPQPDAPEKEQRGPGVVDIDPLLDLYRESVVSPPERFARQVYERAALLCIDMQILDAARGRGLFADAHAAGVPLEAQEYYFDRLEQLVLPNVRRLQGCFRMYSLEVIHVRIQSMTRDGRDRSAGHKRLRLHAAPGSPEAEFVEQVAPVGDELVINKTASGVFTATNLPYLLRNLGIESLYVTGVYTDECVSTAVRDACDLGYFVTLVEDACATVTAERQRSTIANLRDRYARVVTTQEAIDEIDANLPTERS